MHQEIEGERQKKYREDEKKNIEPFTLLHETIHMMGTKTISAFFIFPYAYTQS